MEKPMRYKKTLQKQIIMNSITKFQFFKILPNIDNKPHKL